MFVTMVLVSFNALPVEYVIDCSGWTGQGKAVVTFRYEAKNGELLKTEVYFDPRSTTNQAVTAFTIWLKDNGWRYEKLGGGHFVIRGSKTSPIKSVTFKGDIWQPVVTARFAIPPETPKK